MTLTITLPILPPRELSSNARAYRYAKSEAQRELKTHVIAALSQQSVWPYAAEIDETMYVGYPAFPWAKVKVKLTFYVPDARRRDKDNYIASMKAGLDALQGRVIKDDRDIVGIEAEFIKDKANPRTVMEIEEVKHD